ncbi:hypothetical protein QUF80_04420 [Desulfococcaceae bacterium HSG8]|nr:hypothetical protein [Desulfococcaceae bacterium HSG8]
MKKHTTSQSPPQRFRLPMNDEGIFSGCEISDMLIHCVISFDKRIDENRMSEAVRLTLDAEPVLGCRLGANWWRMYWERRTDLDSLELFKITVSEDVEEEVIRFLSVPADPRKDPQVGVLLIRSETDTLCIKVNHTVSDAGGVKTYAYLLASVYRNLADNPGYKPEINLNGSRSMRQVSRQFGIMDKLRIIRRTFRDLKINVFPRRYCSFLLNKGDMSDRAFVILRIGPDLFRAVKSYGRRRGATINDIILTAIFRGFADLINPPSEVPLRLVTTVDFRRFLRTGRSGAICNLSGILYLKTEHKAEAEFDDTLLQVRDQMNFIKGDFIGLGNHPYFVIPSLISPAFFNLWLGKKMADALFRNLHNIPPGFTNMGAIDAEQLVFGDAEVTDAFLTAPVIFTPFFLIGLSGFGESITISAGFSGASVNRPVVEGVLGRIKRELVLLA